LVLVTALRLGLVLLALALVVAGCGGSEQLPPDRAAALVQNLDTIDQGVSGGECAKTRPALRRLQEGVHDLPKDVDAGVRTTLDTGVSHLEDLYTTQCKQKPAPVAKAPSARRVIATPPRRPPVTTPRVSKPQVTTPTVPKVTPPKIEKPKQPKQPTQEPQNGGSTDGQGSTTGQTDPCGTNPSAEC